MTALSALPELVSPKEAALMLGVSTDTITGWADKRKINHLRTLGGHRRFYVSDLLEFRQRLTVKAID